GVTGMTMTGTSVGTPDYMAPEVREGQNATAKSDIYALGVIWYEMLTGHKPFGLFLAPSSTRTDCPKDWDVTISCCLATDPQTRPVRVDLKPPIYSSTTAASTAPAGPVLPKLWNPGAAAIWSLLFGPAFGAWLHAVNWGVLGKPWRATANAIW